MKTVFIACLLFVSLFSSEFDREKASYENLATDPWTDHIRSFHDLFQLQKIHSFLEFGLGRATQYFLDNCDEVTSIELVVENRRMNIEPWYLNSIRTFENYQNWKPSIHYFSPCVDEADRKASLQLDPELSDVTYLKEIQSFMNRVFQDRHFDLVFVDPGILIRGDLVNALFDRVDIIVAHDTACTIHKMYGYYKVECPDNYFKIESKYGSGTTFWIKKEREDLIFNLLFLLPDIETVLENSSF